MASHTIAATGDVIVKLRVDSGPRITLLPGGSRGITLSTGNHDVTVGIMSQAGRKWTLKVFETDTPAKVVWKDSGTLPDDGLEILTDEFHV